MNWSDWLHAVFLMLVFNAVAGNLFFLLWRFLRYVNRKVVDIQLIYGMLKSAVLFYFIPFLFLAVLYRKHQRGGWYDYFSFEENGILLSVLEVVWLAGIVVQVIRTVHSYLVSLYNIRCGCIPCTLELEEECEVVRKRLKIHCRVGYQVKYMSDSAFVSGLIHPVIYLPVKGLEKEERDIVILHEMNHIREGDAFWKCLATVLCCLYWFDPLIRVVRDDVDEWSESYCDFSSCREMGDSQEYFDVLVRMVSDCVGGMKSSWIMEFCRNRKDLNRRIAIMRKHQKTKKLRRTVMVLLSVLLLMVSSTTVWAATVASLDAYKSSFLSDVEDSKADVAEEDGLIEYQISLDEMDVGNLIIVDEGISVASTTVSFTWSVPAGNMVLSSGFYKTSGSTISVAATITPSTSTVELGIIDPSNIFHYVEGTGALSHTFTLTESGTYCVAAYNISSVQVTVAGTYVK